ncbi:MAG: sn-glycerol-3-phosphate ABC transporter ATP-binding protein UgpC [Geminicoccaceae bacterium]|nr:sn-glycerol-3-phosphate ABC transporter ATP-binding protein UgpC [Geminicoccaceae bacterium]
MAEVTIERVSKSFGTTHVLHDVSVAVGDGEMLVILGPSGCGKSTLLRCVAGLERVSGGEIRIGGRVVNDLEPMERDIAMVFQTYALYPHMSVFDNMAYGLRNRGMERPEIDRRVRGAAATLGLADLLARKPRQLSGGQRQRVAMGRAIVREPAAFLFDEPLSNLDAKLRVQMRQEVRDLQTRLNATGVYVTHDQVEAMTLGDRLLVLNAGRVEQIGAPLDVYERPESLFVAGFIGSPPMNTLPARGEGDAVEVAGRRIPLPPGTTAEPGRPILLGVRPEHLTLAGEGLPLLVRLVEALGADTVIHGTLEGTDAPLVVRAPGILRAKQGDRLYGTVPARALCLFDPETGRAIGL